MNHPQAGNPGLWFSKQEATDALIALEVAKARAEIWEETARANAEKMAQAQATIREMEQTQMEAVQDAINQGFRDGRKRGHVEGAGGVLLVLGVLAVVL